jgi:ABC-type tungstate transport system permease subunit
MSTDPADCVLCAIGLSGAEDGAVFSTDEPIVSGGLTGGTTTQNEWQDFTPPATIPMNHPWLSRYASSVLLFQDTGASEVSTRTSQTFGNPDHPIAFNIGCGREALEGVAKALSEAYLGSINADFSIGLVSNHSRQSLAALLADIVQLTFSDEPHNETIALGENWCNRTRTVLTDRSILVGPASDPTGLKDTNTLAEALQKITSAGGPKQMLFHSCGDGSATFYRKLQLWLAAGIDVSNMKWAKAYARDRFDALAKAATEGAYIMTERSTYLLAKDRGIVPGLRVFVEEDPVLVTPCSALVNAHLAGNHGTQEATKFADWLVSERALEIVKTFGRDLSYAKALFSPAAQVELGEDERLKGRGI